MTAVRNPPRASAPEAQSFVSDNPYFATNKKGRIVPLRKPLLLAHPAYVPTDPFTPPNPDGFVRYASVAANLSFVNDTTVSVVMAPREGEILFS